MKNILSELFAPNVPWLIMMLLLLVPGCRQDSAAEMQISRMHIRKKPVLFGETRKKLSLRYYRKHYDPSAQDTIIKPRMIVIHWTATRTLASAFNIFYPEKLSPSRSDITRGGMVNVSAHYLVDRDGAVYCLMPDNWMGRHVIGLNHCAIGIENIGGPGHPLTVKQLESNARLVKYLVKKYPDITYVVGHHEYRVFKNHPLWKERDPDYITCKIDPGKDFMKKLRLRLSQLGIDQILDLPSVE